MSRRGLRAITALVLAAASLAAVAPGAAVGRPARTHRRPGRRPPRAGGARGGRRHGGALRAGKSRLIGVDTPEVYGGPSVSAREASATPARRSPGRTVRYTAGREPRDRFGRRLVYLWLPDGRSFNALLVAAGYATPLTIPPNSDYAGTFRRLAREAREHRRGPVVSTVLRKERGLRREAH